MSKPLRPGYFRLTFCDPRGRDKTVTITAVYANELLTYCFADWKRGTNRELRLRRSHTLVRDADGFWTPIQAPDVYTLQAWFPADPLLRLRLNADILNSRALFAATAADLESTRWIHARAAR